MRGGSTPAAERLDRLCHMFALGRRSLERRFKQATGNTVSEYIQRVKIEAAKKKDGLQEDHQHVAKSENASA